MNIHLAKNEQMQRDLNEIVEDECSLSDDDDNNVIYKTDHKRNENGG